MLKIILDSTKGAYEASDSIGAYNYPHTLITASKALTEGGAYAVSASAGPVVLTLPTKPVDGDTFKVCKASTTAFTVSVTSSAHPVNGGIVAVDLLTAFGTKEVQFVGKGINMWVAG